MSTPEIDEAIKEFELWYAIVNSLAKFDELEVKGVVSGQFRLMLPEECIVSIYYRVSANVSSLLELRTPKHFQAIGMLARSIFELALDAEIFDHVPGAPIKMRVFMDIEKLRACRSAVEFAKSKPLTLQRSIKPQEDYIAANETRIIGLAASTWNGLKFSDITHWSGIRMPDRARMLPDDMQELYAFYYRQLSWAVHSGLEGSYGVKPETFARMCGMAFNLAARDYQKVLMKVMRTLKLDKADPIIDKKMQLARYLPLTEKAQQEIDLRSDLGL